MSGNTGNKMGMLIAVFAVVIAAVAYFGVKYPVPEEQTAGTIAPAERYRGEQISSDDVQLADESVAQVMQTDVYQKLVSDAAFADALRSDALRNVMATDAFRQAMASDALRSAMGNDSFRQALKSYPHFGLR